MVFIVMTMEVESMDWLSIQKYDKYTILTEVNTVCLADIMRVYLKQLDISKL